MTGAFSYTFGSIASRTAANRALDQRMGIAAHGDPKCWTVASVLLNDPIGAQVAQGVYAGHVAFAVGDDDAGWYYYSSDGDKYVNEYFSKYSDMASSDTIARYSRALYIVGNSAQDAVMQQYANSNFGRQYDGLWYNCADYAFGDLSTVWGASVGYTTGYSPVSIPNWRYEAMKNNSGLGREFNPKEKPPY